MARRRRRRQIAAKSKRAQPVRSGSDFALRRLLARLRAPLSHSEAYLWDLAAIMAARDAQIAGRFREPVKLATAMRTCPPLHTAYKNRLAPLRSLDVEIVPARGTGAGTIAGEAEAMFGCDGVAVGPDTVAAINGDLANHGIAIGYNDWALRPDAKRYDLVHRCWPLEHVEWWEHRQQLVTMVDSDESDTKHRLMPIVHGDGRWTIYTAHELRPWQQDACVMSGALVWAAVAFANRDWAKASSSHGNAKVVGELPEGVDLQAVDDEGNVSLSDHATHFLALLQDIAALDVPVGIRPNGSTVDYMTNTSKAWEVFERLALNGEKHAARIYLGTDGTLGAQGGAPGVDIAELFGVATTIIQGDRSTFERCFHSGVMVPWTAVNFGDSRLAPRRSYIMPDPDAVRAAEEQRAERADYITREAAYCDAIKRRRDCGLEVTQDWANKLARELCVEPGNLTGVPSPAAPLRSVK